MTTVYSVLECLLSLSFNERFHMAFVQSRNNRHLLLLLSSSLGTVKQHSIININTLGICRQSYPFSLAARIDVLHYSSEECVGASVYHCQRLNRLQPTSYQNANCIVTTHIIHTYSSIFICDFEFVPMYYGSPTCIRAINIERHIFNDAGGQTNTRIYI